MDEKKLLAALLLLGMLLAVAVVGVNLLSMPNYSAPVFSPASSEASFSPSDSADTQKEKAWVQFPLNINTATAQELQLIPDIGPATSEMIVAFVKDAGTILDIDELLSVDGIGEKTVERLKEYCVAE